MKRLLNRRLWALVVMFFIVLKADCQEENVENSLLWYVVNEHQPADTSYLFGTIHLIPNQDFEITPRLKNSLMKTEVLMTEVDLTRMDAMLGMAAQTHLPKGETLKEMIDSIDYALLDTFLLNNLGVSMALYNNQKPMVLMMTVMNVFVGGQPASYDLALTLMATQAGKKVIGLETIEEQMAILDQISHKEMMQSIVEMVSDIEKAREDFNAMVIAYKKENLEKLDELLKIYETGGGDNEKLLDERNVKWIPLIETAMEEHTTFIAVGAGHLAGEKGLVHLLRQKGYTVKPVMNSQ